MENKKHFHISESFYKATFEPENYNFYGIGTWNICVIEKYRKIDMVIFNNYLLQLLSCLPWLTVKEVGLRSHINKWEQNKSNIDYLNWLKIMEKSNYDKKDFAMDLGQAYFDCNISKEDEIITFDKGGSIYFSFDDTYGDIGFSLDLDIDFFTSNPSQQLGVFLSEDDVCYNNSLLTDSLKTIDKSDVFEIIGFESAFHSKRIYEYGFFSNNELIANNTHNQ